MIKETRSLIRLLNAKLQKGLTHQWFLNQYVKKHKLESLIVCNNVIEYDTSKRIISFKNSSRRRTLKSSTQKYNVENATFVLLKDIHQVGGGWLGTIVICSSCVNTLYAAWVMPRISLLHIHQILDTIITNKIRPHCACAHEKRKILTACKPILYIHKNTENVFGLINNSFLIPSLLYDINNLVYMPQDKFIHVMENIAKPSANLIARTHRDDPVPGLAALAGQGMPRNADRNNELHNSQPLFVSLLQLMFFWLKNGPVSTNKLFRHYVLEDLKKIKWS